MHAQQCKKIAYLARLMREDIAAGVKIFVIHGIPHEIARDRLSHLLSLLRSRGARDLVYMRRATPQYPAGSVIREPDGLFIGHVLDQSVGHEDFEGWRTALKTMIAMVDADG